MPAAQSSTVLNSGTGGNAIADYDTGTTSNGAELHVAEAQLVTASGGTVTPIGSGNPLSVSGAVTVTGTATASQGTAAALSGAWPVKVTDGTNTLPTGDAIARSIAVQLNDASNVLGTAAHPVKIDPTGTTTQPVSGTVTANNTTAANLLANVGGLAAAGTTASGNPVLVAGKDQSGNAQTLNLAVDKSVFVVPNSNQQAIHSNATVTTSGSASVNVNLGAREVDLIVNVVNAPTGTAPTLTYTIQEIDPGTLTTAVGTTVTGAAIAAAGTQIIKLPDTTTGVVKVSWTVAGTTPSFTGVYATLVNRATEDVVEQYAPVAEDNTTGVIACASKPLSVSTYTPSFSSGVASLPGNVKSSTGNLFGMHASNANASVRYLQVFNSTAAPSGAPLASFLIPPSNNVVIGQELFTAQGINLSTGITLGISTTSSTYTAATASDHCWSVTYK